MYNLDASPCYSENEGHFLLQVAGGVKVYEVKHYFSNLSFFYNFFRTIGPTATNLALSCFCRYEESIDTQCCPPPKKRNLTSRPIWGRMSNQVKVGHVGHHSIRGHKKTLWYPFHSFITFGSKVIGRRVISP